MSTLQENVDIIKAQVARMKTALGVDPTTPLEEVTAAVEQGGGSSTPSNIYQVKTLAERDALSAVEGNLCVVLDSNITNATVNDELININFPETVVLPESFTSSVYASFRNEEVYTDLMVILDSSRCRIDIMTEQGYSSIEYTSEDGITYTRITEVETVNLGVPVTCSYPEEWDDNIGYFLQIGGVIFEGIFEYKEDSWEFANIGIDTSADYVYKEKKIYTSKGITEGSLTTTAASSFDDTTAKVFSELMSLYNSTSKIIADADSSYLFSGSNMYCIPSDINGEPLLDTSNVTTMNSMFQMCKNLVFIPKLNTSNVTVFGNMFLSCSKLKTIPLLDTSNGTSFYQMFASCSSLEEIPELNTSNGNSFSSMFHSCSNLKSIPLLDLSKGTRLDNMFLGCSSLETIPNINTGNSVTFTSMFSGCTNLKSIPLLDLSSATGSEGISNMFSNCSSLETIPNLDTTGIKTMNSVFQGCTNLREIPLLNTSSATRTAYLFTGCENLETIPNLNISNSTTIAHMFEGCTNLKNIPALNPSKATIIADFVKNCPNLTEESLNNILYMCIHSAFTSSTNKKASYIGLNDTQKETIKSLSNYSAFVSAGWSAE